jgi:hypothetical protein
MASKSGGNLTDGGERKPVILLPFYLHAQVPSLFTRLGFRCLHMEWFPLKPSVSEVVNQFFDDPVSSRENLEKWQSGVIAQYVKWAKSEKIDVALEWQYGPDDYPILTLVNVVERKLPIFLCLNYRSEPPSNYREMGFAECLKVPWEVEDIERIHRMICAGMT